MPNEIATAPRSLSGLLDADWKRLLEVSGRSPRARRFFDCFSPRFAAVVLLRLAERLHARGWRMLAKVASFINFTLFGIEVAVDLEIGGGLVLPHTQGTVIGAASIGENVTIFQQVTLGAKVADFSYEREKRPHIGAGVVIAAGAKVLGSVEIGAGATVGANAVVLDDVPPGTLAVGIPARIVERPAAP
jgi:serine O-acetyltransferase